MAYWQRVTQSAPCPACGKPDWCAWSPKGELKCERSTLSPVGMVTIKPQDGGALFRKADDFCGNERQSSRRARKTTNTHRSSKMCWKAESEQLIQQLSDCRLSELATILDVTVDALMSLGVGWANAEDLRRYGASGSGWKQNPPVGAYAFPERNGNGRVVGVCLRARDGRKGAPSASRTGSQRGLIVPETWNDRSGPIVIVEGASDVSACNALQLRAIGRPSNAGGGDQLAKLLEGSEVIVIGENDQKPGGDWPGRDGAKSIASRLATAWGEPIPWGLPPEGVKDIREFLKQRVADGLDLSDLDDCRTAGSELLHTLRSHVVLERPEGLSDLVIAADVESRPVEWLWNQRFAVGKLSMIAGDPGVGKSFLTTDFAARVSTGDVWPDGSPNKSGGVLIVNIEDDMADTIRPRLEAAHANLNRIGHLPFIELTNLASIRAAIKSIAACRLVIVDPISAYMGYVDSHKNAEVRSLLAPLGKLASDLGVAIIAVNHLRKGGDGPAIYRSMGSLALVAAARAA